MSPFGLDADLASHDVSADGELFADAAGQVGRRRPLDRQAVAADRVPQFGRGPQRHQPPRVEDPETVAALGFFHEVRRHEDGDAGFFSQLVQIAPQIEPRAGVEAGAGFIEEQHLGIVEQAFGDFDAAGQAPGERFDAVAGPVGQPQPRQQRLDPPASPAPDRP